MASPGIAWGETAASAYRAYHASLEGVSAHDPLPPFESLPPELRVAWEAVARQVNRCLKVKSAGPAPDESVWAGWTPPAGDPPDPPGGSAPAAPPPPGDRRGAVGGIAVHALVAVLFLAAALAVSRYTNTKAGAMDGYQGHYRAAFQATQSRDHGRAAEEWKKARAAGGDQAECLRNAAEAAWHASDLAGAEAAARELLTLVPRSWAAHYILGLVAEKRGERPAATRYYRLAAHYATTDDDRRMATRRLTKVN